MDPQGTGREGTPEIEVVGGIQAMRVTTRIPSKSTAQENMRGGGGMTPKKEVGTHPRIENTETEARATATGGEVKGLPAPQIVV